LDFPTKFSFIFLPSALKIVTLEKVNFLREVLDDKGVKQNWLAQRLNVTDNTVSNWCNNKAQPSLLVLKQIAVLLSVDITDLLKPVQKQ
jgi:transcriptional regulator with XRE-family HTH domain